MANAPRMPHLPAQRILDLTADRLLASRTPAKRILDLALDRLPVPHPSAKRVFDLTAGPLLLLAAAPVLLLAAAASAVTSPGPVLVRKTRAGLAGRPFEMLSLRTAPGTPVGRLLRRSRIDVLPRLLQVMRGEMSLVGPCALPPGHPEGALVGRQLMRPGLTGLWQVGGRSDLPWDEMGVLDAHYLDHHWIGLDLKILARTVPAALAMCR
ncbi:sugar transferase [Streptomyces sp. A5-4]|uniref:sugar transferase n=1 Tax=Streptomyces sp. A5-4 TaxID=3384771 RepID=UPI003DA7D746